ncbi:MAG: hypothetical protein IMZ62_13035 [Chloroflexi bacterium]|nr:hypothetical protein [Chloroflexota bacterium]
MMHLLRFLATLVAATALAALALVAGLLMHLLWAGIVAVTLLVFLWYACEKEKA